MFKNPGKKVKLYAKIIFWIGAVLSLLLGIGFGIAFGSFKLVEGEIIAAKSFDVLSFLLTFIGGSVASFIGSLFLCAFGQLVQDTEEIKAKLQSDK